jgi:hypothetical protein
LSNERLHQDFASSIRCVWDAVIALVSAQGFSTWVNNLLLTTTAEQHHLGGREWNQVLKDGSAFLFDFLTNDEDRRSTLLSQSSDENTMKVLEDLSVGGDPEAYAALAENYCSNRSFIITSRRGMGIGPADTQPGDFVHVLYGGGVPYIARKLGSCWLFIGESYLHDFINGEAIQAQMRGEMQKEMLEFQ